MTGVFSQKSAIERLLDLSTNRVLEEAGLAAALHLIGTNTLDILDIPFSVIWLLDESQAQLRCHAQAGLHLASNETQLEASQLPQLMQALEQNDGSLISDAMTKSAAAAEIARLFGQAQFASIVSLMAIPLRLHGRCAGTICLAQTGDARNWSRDEVLFARHIGNLVQQVLSHAEHVKNESELEDRVKARTLQLQQQTTQLQEAHGLIFRLGEIGREITSSLDRETIIEILYRHVHDLMGAEVFAVGLYHPTQESIEFPCNILRGKRMLPYARDARDTDLLSAWCIHHQKEIFINDIYTQYQAYISAEGLNKLTVDSAYFSEDEKIVPLSHIYTPLIIKNRTIGVIAIQSTQKNAFQRVHLDIATMLAAYTAIAIENADTYQQLQKAQQILISQEKLAALGALVAGVAHELNTPIGNSLLTATTLQEQSAVFMKKLNENSLKRSDLNNFSAMINNANDLLIRNLMNASDLVSSFKQVSVDQTSQKRRTFNLKQTTMEVVRTLHNLIHQRGHTLDIEIPDDIQMNSFPGPYGQILNNFINNAILHAFEHRENGKMLLRARKTMDGQVQLVFSDNGQGIETSDLRKIFDPFFTTKLGHGGSGLGLSIVHNLATSIMHGNIEVESIPGLGTRFILTLPLEA